MGTGEGTAGPVRDAELARTLLVEAREELLKADNKAGFLLATLGAMLTALLGTMCSGVIEPRRHAAISQALLWGGCITCLMALVLLGLAVAPASDGPASSGPTTSATRVRRRPFPTWRKPYAAPHHWTVTSAN